MDEAAVRPVPVDTSEDGGELGAEAGEPWLRILALLLTSSVTMGEGHSASSPVGW